MKLDALKGVNANLSVENDTLKRESVRHQAAQKEAEAMCAELDDKLKASVQHLSDARAQNELHAKQIDALEVEVRERTNDIEKAKRLCVARFPIFCMFEVLRGAPFRHTILTNAT